MLRPVLGHDQQVLAVRVALTAEEFLWQYIYSTPLAGAAAGLDDDARAALQREVVTGWESSADDGRLVLEIDVTIATARRT